MDTVSHWKKAKNILCIRADNMGDLLMTEPALRALKHSVPNRKITLLTSNAGSIIAPYIKSIDKTIVSNLPWVKSETSQTNPETTTTLIRKLKSRNFDAAIIFTVFSQNPLPAAMLTYLANIPLRAAFCHERPYDLLTDWIRDPEPEQFIRHEVLRQLFLVGSLGAKKLIDDRITISIPKKSYPSLEQKLKTEHFDTNQPFVIIHPGVSSLARQYSPTSFARIAHRISKEFSLPIVFTGSTSEVDLVQSIQKGAHIPTTNLAGKLSIDELIVLIECSKLLISNNTGPAHIAAAVGTPVLDLYALTNPQHTPWRTRSKVLYFQVAKNLRSSVTLDTPPLIGEPLKNFATIIQSVHELLRPRHKKPLDKLKAYKHVLSIK